MAQIPDSIDERFVWVSAQREVGEVRASERAIDPQFIPENSSAEGIQHLDIDQIWSQELILAGQPAGDCVEWVADDELAVITEFLAVATMLIAEESGFADAFRFEDSEGGLPDPPEGGHADWV